jgi:DNA polymerase-3 subunit delta'
VSAGDAGAPAAPAGGTEPGPSPAVDLYAAVVGQPAAVDQLRAAAVAPVHAHLLVGPAGSGRLAAARAFAAALLCPAGGDGTCRSCRLALAGEHPDVVTFEPEGAFLRVADAQEITRLSLRSPVEGARKVLILTGIERIQQAGPALLKTIEEPPPSTVFVLLAEHVPPELVTIASRCARITFGPVPVDALAARLVAEGLDPAVAAVAAAGAGGSLPRARLLATDPGVEGRRRAWSDVPGRLDGTGATVATIVDELGAMMDDAGAPLAARQRAELEAAAERDAAGGGGRAGARRDLEARHRREARRHRTEELRAGLAALVGRYRDALERDPGGPGAAAALQAADAVQAAAEALPRSPNEALLLQALLLRLPPLAGSGDRGGDW